MSNPPANLVASMSNVGGNVGAANLGANAAAAAVKQATAVGAPKSIRNRLRNAAASLKSGASKLGKWISSTFMGRNAAGNSRWTRYGRGIKSGFSGMYGKTRNAITRGLNRYKFLNRFRSGAAARRAGRNLANIVKQRPAMFEGNAHSRRSRRGSRRSRR